MRRETGVRPKKRPFPDLSYPAPGAVGRRARGAGRFPQTDHASGAIVAHLGMSDGRCCAGFGVAAGIVRRGHARSVPRIPRAGIGRSRKGSVDACT
jgi:hypothetical protein